MKMNYARIVQSAALGLLLSSGALRLQTATATPLGSGFSYQGKLAQNGVPANGSFDMQFYLRDAVSGGNPVGPTNAIAPIVVTNGLFNVILDFGPVFAGQSLWLEIGVRTNGSVLPYTTLVPRQPLAPSPGALYAELAGAVTNGAITSAMLANGAITSSKLAANAVTGAALTNTISLGTPGINGELDIYHTTPGGPAISLFGSSSQISIYGHGDNLEKVRLVDGSGIGELLLNNNLGFQGAALVANFFNGGGLLALNNTNGQTRASVSGGSSGGVMYLWNSSGTNTISVDGNSSAFNAYSSVDGSQKVNLGGSPWGELDLYNQRAGGFKGAELFGGTGGGGGELWLFNSNGVLRADLGGNNLGGYLDLWSSNNIHTVHLDSSSGTGAFLDMYNSINGRTLHLDTSGDSWLAGSRLAIGPTFTPLANLYVLGAGGVTGLDYTNQAAIWGDSATSLNGVVGTTLRNTGFGVAGEAPNGLGVSGIGQTGVYGISSSTTGIGMFGYSQHGTGAEGFSNDGVGVWAHSDTGSGLDIDSGAIQVAGAGIGTSTAVFVHRATAANIEVGNTHRTTISNPFCDGNPNAILIITPNYNPSQTGNVLDTHPLGVFYNGSLLKWQLYHQDFAAMTANAAYNVLIVKP
jgi:hypothetical protein